MDSLDIPDLNQGFNTKRRLSNAIQAGQLDKVDYHTRRRMSNTLVAGMNKDEPLADHLSDLFKKATEETLEVDETTLIRGAGKFFKKKADQSMLTSFDKDTNTELEVSIYIQKNLCFKYLALVKSNCARSYIIHVWKKK